MRKKGNLWIDVSKCLACRGCEFACAVQHSRSKTMVGAIRESPPPQSRVSLTAVENLAIPLQCRHCEDAPCVAICPTKALDKQGPEGPVLIDAPSCIGCKFCIAVCPFGVITLSADGKAALKCDLCIERLDAGDDPACVAACKTGAMKFLDIEEWVKARRKEAAQRMAQGASRAEKIKTESKP